MEYRCVICLHSKSSIGKGDKNLRSNLHSNATQSRNEIGNTMCNFIMCKDCFKLWSWSPNERFFRKRGVETKWAHQYNLYLNVRDVAAEYGIKPSRVYTEVGFPDLVLSEKGWPLRFDIAIPSKKFVIEYNGEQHYRYTKPWHSSYDDFLRQKKNDTIKIDAIKKNNWSALIFTYMEDVMNKKWVRVRMEQVLGKP